MNVPKEILASMPTEWSDGTCPECGRPAKWTAESGMLTQAQAYVECVNCDAVEAFMVKTR